MYTHIVSHMNHYLHHRLLLYGEMELGSCSQQSLLNSVSHHVNAGTHHKADEQHLL